MPAQGRVVIDGERCKACELCIEVCPTNILELGTETNSHGYRMIQVTDMNNCTGCTLCARICPDMVFDVFKNYSRRDRQNAVSEQG